MITSPRLSVLSASLLLATVVLVFSALLLRFARAPLIGGEVRAEPLATERTAPHSATLAGPPTPFLWSPDRLTTTSPPGTLPSPYVLVEHLRRGAPGDHQELFESLGLPRALDEYRGWNAESLEVRLDSADLTVDESPEVLLLIGCAGLASRHLLLVLEEVGGSWFLRGHHELESPWSLPVCGTEAIGDRRYLCVHYTSLYGTGWSGKASDWFELRADGLRHVLTLPDFAESAHPFEPFWRQVRAGSPTLELQDGRVRLTRQYRRHFQFRALQIDFEDPITLAFEQPASGEPFRPARADQLPVEAFSAWFLEGGEQAWLRDEIERAREIAARGDRAARAALLRIVRFVEKTEPTAESGELLASLEE